MGSDETAITIPGGPRVIDVFSGNGAPSGPIDLLFSGVDGSGKSLGYFWGRVEAYAASAAAWCSPESSGSKTWGTWALARWLAEKITQYVSIDGSARACAVADCTCLLPSLSGPRETSGPRIDRIPPARPSWRDRQHRELKK